MPKAESFQLYGPEIQIVFQLLADAKIKNLVNRGASHEAVCRLYERIYLTANPGHTIKPEGPVFAKQKHFHYRKSGD